MYDSDRHPALKYVSDCYITDICTSDLCPFFKFSNRHPILKSMAVSHFLKSTSNDVTDVCPNPKQEIGQIWEFGKNADLRIPLNRTVIWDNDISGCQFEEWALISVWTLIWVYHIYLIICKKNISREVSIKLNSVVVISRDDSG
jgi:hypothetical protein